MILFSLKSYEYLASSILEKTDLEQGQFDISHFPNQELLVILETPVEGEDCVVLGSTVPDDNEILSLLLLIHTLKIQGAKKITVLIPYLSYARQDRKEDNKSLAASWIGEIFKASGADEVVVVRVHSPEVPVLFPIPLTSLSSVGIFAKELALYPASEITLVAPDEGAMDMCKALKKSLNLKSDIAYFRKERTIKGVTLSDLHGEVKGRAVVVDDMLDTGGTMIECIRKLKEHGVDKIVIIVTHGLFTGSKWEELWDLGVDKIYCTDTVPHARELASDKIKVLSIKPIFVEYLNEISK